MNPIVFLLINAGIDLGSDFYNKKSVQIKGDELIEENSFNKLVEQASLLKGILKSLNND